MTRSTRRMTNELLKLGVEPEFAFFDNYATKDAVGVVSFRENHNHVLVSPKISSSVVGSCATLNTSSPTTPTTRPHKKAVRNISMVTSSSSNTSLSNSFTTDRRKRSSSTVKNILNKTTSNANIHSTPKSSRSSLPPISSITPNKKNDRNVHSKSQSITSSGSIKQQRLNDTTVGSKYSRAKSVEPIKKENNRTKNSKKFDDIQNKRKSNIDDMGNQTKSIAENTSRKTSNAANSKIDRVILSPVSRRNDRKSVVHFIESDHEDSYDMAEYRDDSSKEDINQPSPNMKLLLEYVRSTIPESHLVYRNSLSLFKKTIGNALRTFIKYTPHQLDNLDMVVEAKTSDKREKGVQTEKVANEDDNKDETESQPYIVEMESDDDNDSKKAVALVPKANQRNNRIKRVTVTSGQQISVALGSDQFGNDDAASRILADVPVTHIKQSIMKHSEGMNGQVFNEVQQGPGYHMVETSNLTQQQINELIKQGFEYKMPPPVGGMQDRLNNSYHFLPPPPLGYDNIHNRTMHH